MSLEPVCMCWGCVLGSLCFALEEAGRRASLKHLPCFCVSLTVATVSDCGHQGGR